MVRLESYGISLLSIGSEIVLDTPMELLGDMGHVEPHFFLFGDSGVDAR